MTQDTKTFSSENPLRVAIFGSGPSGIFAAESLIKQADIPLQVDIFDRLPTPYGLVRYGVAPDHLTIKSVTKAFDKTLSDDRVRFLGNVEFGKDISYQQAKKHYHALIYAVGASSDRRLGIEGENLAGSLSATEFVAWYNGHPDAQGNQATHIKQSLARAKAVAVIGVGNVALDVSRILAKTADELQSSDITAEALEQLAQSGVEDIYILGRRGPAQAKFTTKELREFGDLSNAEPVVIASEIALNEAEEAAITDNTTKKNLEVLRNFASRESIDKPRRVHLRFLTSPIEVLAENGQVSGLKVERNRLENGRAIGTGESEILPVQMLLRSVGYLGQPLPEVPFDEQRAVIANQDGRVSQRTGEYTTGWIKRGPSGVIGTNRKCASDTVALLLADVAADQLGVEQSNLEQYSRQAVDELLSEVDVYYFADWQELNDYEIAAGKAAGRPRQKVTQRSEMLKQRANQPDLGKNA